MRAFLLLLVLAMAAAAASFKLYLKDGSDQIVREYQINGDRVHYYSAERQQWEDIPVALIDLEKTESERKRISTERAQETKLTDEEEKAERAQRREIEQIPMNAGAYVVRGGTVQTMEYADATLVTNKRRQTLKMLSPIPIVAGKASLEVKGEHAKFVVNDDEPAFYLRLEQLERFSMIRLTPKKGNRVVEDVSILPVSNETVEDQKTVSTFQRELGPGLYKIWPQKPLAIGEYALIEFTDEELNERIWDFSYQGPSPAATPQEPATDSKKSKD